MQSALRYLIVCLLSVTFLSPIPAQVTPPLVDAGTVFQERDGQVAVEAEHFFKQSRSEPRGWYLHASQRESVAIEPDGDPAHVAGASNGAYLECLPDTRRTHADKLIKGQNFANEAGQQAVLHYKVHFENPGKYYVWVRAFSTGSEDNGIHVGLDGDWPSSGQRMQWCAGKHGWRWESKQRTEKEHCGVPHEIYLEIDKAGEHEILFSMREDGFEFDKFVLTTDRDFPRPDGLGPEVLVHAGPKPNAFSYVPAAAADESAGAGAEPQARGEDGDGSVAVSGELRQWHKITLSLNGPYAHEQDNAPNPYTDYALTGTFEHDSGSRYVVPGYFAADGDAANTSAEAGTCWRLHFAPDQPGRWSYKVELRQGQDVALDDNEAGKTVHAVEGQLQVAASDKKGRDFRAQGRLNYVGGHYLQFAGSQEYFLKAGPDAPETLLGYADFDGTVAGKPNKVPLKTWQAHVRDWSEGDPTWQSDKGKGLIGALNYIASRGCNSFSFLPYNAGGDGDNVWPFVERDDKLHYDCSKLDQWGIVFDHATSLGLYLHFKLQENEIDDNRRGHQKEAGTVPESLDGGKLGRERKLYCRELIARFGHALALNWNIGEENTQSAKEQREMIAYLWNLDPYQHLIVIHTFPDQQDQVYGQLLGDQSLLTGASLQNSWSAAHARTLKWRLASARAGRPWVVCNDEQNPASDGVPPDPGYEGHDGYATQNGNKYNLHDIRKQCLWGTLMAGGAGVEYYFGYKLPQNDLICEDFRSREQSWEYCRIALNFFRENNIPFWEMKCLDAVAGGNDPYCFAKPGELYLVYLPAGGNCELAVSDADQYQLAWFNPREGGELQAGEFKTEGSHALFTAPSDDDWLAVFRKSAE